MGREVLPIHALALFAIVVALAAAVLVGALLVGRWVRRMVRGRRTFRRGPIGRSDWDMGPPSGDG